MRVTNCPITMQGQCPFTLTQTMSRGWNVKMCSISCRLQLVLPASDLAVCSTKFSPSPSGQPVCNCVHRKQCHWLKLKLLLVVSPTKLSLHGSKPSAFVFYIYVVRWSVKFDFSSTGCADKRRDKRQLDKSSEERIKSKGLKTQWLLSTHPLWPPWLPWRPGGKKPPPVQLSGSCGSTHSRC